jgi:hypothetical protein
MTEKKSAKVGELDDAKQARHRQHAATPTRPRPRPRGHAHAATPTRPRPRGHAHAATPTQPRPRGHARAATPCGHALASHRCSGAALVRCRSLLPF